MNNINKIIKERQDKIVAQINASGLRGSVFPEMSLIRLQQELKSGMGQYVFNIKDPNVDNITTFSLDRNDVFIPNLWGVRLVLKNTVTGELRAFTFAPRYDGTHPSIYQVGFATGEIEAIFNGSVQWILDNNVAMSAYPMVNFKKVPETQGLFVLDADGNAVQEGIQLQHNINDDLELLYSKYQICGTRDHKITVLFDAANKNFALASQATEGNDVVANWKPYVELIMLGFLVKGGCQTPAQGTNPFGQAAGQW